MKEGLIIKLKEILSILDSLQKGNRFPAYHDIKNAYFYLLKLSLEKDSLKKEDFGVIQNCMRMFSEAPLRDTKLDLKILNIINDISIIRDQMILEIEKK